MKKKKEKNSENKVPYRRRNQKKKKRKRHQKTGKTPNGAPSCSKSTTSKEGEKKKRKWEFGDKTKRIKALKPDADAANIVFSSVPINQKTKKKMDK